MLVGYAAQYLRRVSTAEGPAVSVLLMAADLTSHICISSLIATFLYRRGGGGATPSSAGVGVAARRRSLNVSAILSMVTPQGCEGGKGADRIWTA